MGALIALLATLGAAVWGAFVFFGWRAHVEDFPRVTPPGTAVVSVTDAGTQVIYLEHDRDVALPSVPATTVTDPSGAAVSTATYQGDLRYDVPGVANRIGEAVLSFRAGDPGTYRVTVGEAAPGTTVALGDDLVWDWAPEVVGVVALFLGGLLVGLTIVLVTAVRRSGPTS